MYTSSLVRPSNQHKHTKIVKDDFLAHDNHTKCNKLYTIEEDKITPKLNTYIDLTILKYGSEIQK